MNFKHSACHKAVSKLLLLLFTTRKRRKSRIPWGMKRLLRWNNGIGYIGFSDKGLNELVLREDTDHILIISST